MAPLSLSREIFASAAGSVLHVVLARFWSSYSFITLNMCRPESSGSPCLEILTALITFAGSDLVVPFRLSGAWHLSAVELCQVDRIYTNEVFSIAS
jgi:hypothetical protein